MIAVDTNILVYAHRQDAPLHAAARAVVRTLAEGDEPWAIPAPCVHEFFAIATQPKIYRRLPPRTRPSNRSVPGASRRRSPYSPRTTNTGSSSTRWCRRRRCPARSCTTHGSQRSACVTVRDCSIAQTVISAAFHDWPSRIPWFERRPDGAVAPRYPACMAQPVPPTDAAACLARRAEAGERAAALTGAERMEIRFWLLCAMFDSRHLLPADLSREQEVLAVHRRWQRLRDSLSVR